MMSSREDTGTGLGPNYCAASSPSTCWSVAVIHPPEATRPVMEADVHEDAGSEDRKVAIRLVKEHP